MPGIGDPSRWPGLIHLMRSLVVTIFATSFCQRATVNIHEYNINLIEFQWVSWIICPLLDYNRRFYR